MEKILVVGATSAIAEATARIYAARGAEFCLVARDAERLRLVAADLTVRGARVADCLVRDFGNAQDSETLIDDAAARLGALDLVLVAHGVLPDQAACQQSVATLREVFEINAQSVMSLLTQAANLMEARGRGTLAVLCSVAGDRGRRSNYVYGACKSAVETFLSGLRNRLHTSGVHVLTVKPGFVDTPMTAAFAKGPLWASPDQIARGIVSAIERRRDVVYLPWFWRVIMFVIRAIPEAVFKRLSL